MAKEPILVMFDIDGTLAKKREIGSIPDIFADDALITMAPYPNLIDLVLSYRRKSHARVLFCTGRPKRSHRATWRWLNQHIGMSEYGSGKGPLIVCRPDDVPEANIPTFKLQEIVQALRRIGSKPAKAILYDDDVSNLRIFETLRPMVRALELYRVEEGVVSRWG